MPTNAAAAPASRQRPNQLPPSPSAEAAAPPEIGRRTPAPKPATAAVRDPSRLRLPPSRPSSAEPQSPSPLPAPAKPSSAARGPATAAPRNWRAAAAPGPAKTALRPLRRQSRMAAGGAMSFRSAHINPSRRRRRLERLQGQACRAAGRLFARRCAAGRSGRQRHLVPPAHRWLFHKDVADGPVRPPEGGRRRLLPGEIMRRSRAIYGCGGPVLSADEQAFFREARPWGFILFAPQHRNTRPSHTPWCAALRETVG